MAFSSHSWECRIQGHGMTLLYNVIPSYTSVYNSRHDILKESHTVCLYQTFLYVILLYAKITIKTRPIKEDYDGPKSGPSPS